MLEQIAADEAALAALTATCGQREELEGEGEKLEAEIAGLQEEKWRLSQWNQLEQIKSVLIGGDGEQQEVTSTVMRVDECNLLVCMEVDSLSACARVLFSECWSDACCC